MNINIELNDTVRIFTGKDGRHERIIIHGPKRKDGSHDRICVLVALDGSIEVKK